MSPEARAKLSGRLKGRKLSAETRAKMSAARRGHPMSAEARAKISARLKAYYDAHPELKAKLRKRFFAQQGDMRKGMPADVLQRFTKS